MNVIYVRVSSDLAGVIYRVQNAYIRVLILKVLPRTAKVKPEKTMQTKSGSTHFLGVHDTKSKEEHERSEGDST
jgi:hypothetical protein